MEQWKNGMMVRSQDKGKVEYWNNGINVKNPKDK